MCALFTETYVKLVYSVTFIKIAHSSDVYPSHSNNERQMSSLRIETKIKMDYVDEVLEFLDELAVFNNIQNENIEIIRALNQEVPFRRKYTVQERIDPFQIYDESEFERRYRLSKAQVHALYDYIDGNQTLEPLLVREGFTIPGITKLLVALRFYAVGCFSEPLSDMFGVSKSTACAVVAEVSYLISYHMKERFINMPSNRRSIVEAKAKFHRFANFPLVVGAVDGTNIKIESFGGETAELYRNRKGYFSINCQIVTSADVSIQRSSIISILPSIS